MTPMDTYEILAWLPGTDRFVAKDATGRVGCLRSDGGFAPAFARFFEAAVEKYGYVPLPPEKKTAAALPELERQLRAALPR